MKPAEDRRFFPIPSRVAVILAIAVFHLSCYILVNLITDRRPPGAFQTFQIALDQKIPYLAWTGVFYYFADFFVVFFAALLIWRMPRSQLSKTALVYAGMILTGALIQWLIPVRAPWSENPAAFQKAFRQTMGLKPYACFPSMHVALSVFPALLSLKIAKSAALKLFYVGSAVLISISVITFKEHYILDSITGAALAFIFFSIWRYNFKRRPFAQKDKAAAAADS